ncbi:MAG: aminotransferase class III-fold pyridoxal phosphate-dependent enzyme [Halioglobus sp.]
MNSELLQRRFNVIGKNAPLFYEEPLELVRGEGVWLYDADGKRYLDVYNNVPCCGHSHPKIVEALSSQAATLNIHTRYLHENVVNYLERLTGLFDDSLSMAMLTCTGSEANELALRMARHATSAQGMIVTDAAYHGNTEAVGELGTGFMPESAISQRVIGVPPPDAYRGLPGVSEEDLVAAYVDRVQQAIDTFAQRGIGTAGILICPEFANEGLLNAPAGFVEQAIARVRAAGGLYIADEVQGGFGRTGDHWWSHQAYDCVPDIVTLGKPMGNGHPLAGVVATADLVNDFSEWAMYFNTFAGTPVSSAVGLAVLDVLEQENLLANAVSTGAYVADGLRALQEKHEIIGDVRQKGMFFAAELVTDRATKAPAEEQANALINAMCKRGVLISRIGTYGNILKMRPPMPFQPEHADLLIAALDECLQEL